MLSEHKLDSADFLGKNVSSLPDRPSEAGMTAAELKAAFDRSGEEVIAGHFNDLIDTLSGNNGASGIGTGDGRTVEKRLETCVESQRISQLFGTADGVLILEENGKQCSVGHRIQKEEQSLAPNRKVLAFLGATVEDDADHDRTLIRSDAVMSVNQKSGSHIILSNEDIGAVSHTDFSAHAGNKKNPHNVTAQQIGAVSKQELESVGFDLTPADGVAAGNSICRRWGHLVSVNVMFSVNRVTPGVDMKIGMLPQQLAPQAWITCYGIGRTVSGELAPVCIRIDSNGNITANVPIPVQHISLSASWVMDFSV